MIIIVVDVDGRYGMVQHGGVQLVIIIILLLFIIIREHYYIYLVLF